MRDGSASGGAAGQARPGALPAAAPAPAPAPAPASKAAGAASPAASPGALPAASPGSAGSGSPSSGSARKESLEGGDRQLREHASSVDELASTGSLRQKYEVAQGVLGQGQFAVVRKCRNRESGQNCAVKFIKIKGTSMDRLVQEVEILRALKGHPNIVSLYDVYVTPSEVQLAMELVQGGELFDYLVDNGPYSEAAAAYHMRHIFSAIDFLHRNHIVHRDLKPENLLLTSKDPRYGEVKVADFGLARCFDAPTMQTVCGTWAYCAPEVRNNPLGYGPKVDMWSCGVIMYVLLAAFHPFDPSGQSDEDALWQRAEQAKFDFKNRAWASISASAKDLITKLIVVDPAKRFASDDALGHPWVSIGEHSSEPLSSDINTNLRTVRTKYSRKALVATKAIGAAFAFAQAGQRRSLSIEEDGGGSERRSSAGSSSGSGESKAAGRASPKAVKGPAPPVDDNSNNNKSGSPNTKSPIAAAVGKMNAV
jgi:serine/threonine protein kinase